METDETFEKYSSARDVICSTPKSATAVSADPVALRDQFAAAALTGILACFKDYHGGISTEGRAALAYQYADAMLVARSTPTQGEKA